MRIFFFFLRVSINTMMNVLVNRCFLVVSFKWEKNKSKLHVNYCIGLTHQLEQSIVCVCVRARYHLPDLTAVDYRLV